MSSPAIPTDGTNAVAKRPSTLTVNPRLARFVFQQQLPRAIMSSVPEDSIQGIPGLTVLLLVLFFDQGECGISINNKPFHKSGLQEAFNGSQLLSPGAEQDHLAIIEVLEIDGQCPFI